jgi:hypothetical protein
VLECEDSERWKGYTESLWKASLSEEGDEWTVYQVRLSMTCVLSATTAAPGEWRCPCVTLQHTPAAATSALDP